MRPYVLRPVLAALLPLAACAGPGAAGGSGAAVEAVGARVEISLVAVGR